MDLEAYLASRRQLVESELSRRMDELETRAPNTLLEAMRYSLLAGGKRLRPILTLATCEAVGALPEAAVDAACAVEMVHTYSLIHDDLPSMDDDDFRRGRPTCHKVYGEAIAILAGDALLTEAFGIVAGRPDLGASNSLESVTAVNTRLVVVRELAVAAGAVGMVGGQVIDIEHTGKSARLDELEALHHAKTGELLLLAVRAGALFGGASEEQLRRLSTFGRALGLAFQIVDDVLDVTADLTTLGKDPGSDRQAGKSTFVDLLGVEGSRARAAQVMSEGIAALSSLGPSAWALEALGRYTLCRDR